MSERFTVEVDIRAKDSTGPPLKSAKSGFNEAFSEIASGALRRAGEGLTDFAKQIPGMIVDMGKLGVEVQTNQRRFEQFAGGTARAEMFLEAFNEGTGNTVDRMAAMSSSARLLQMGLVTTGDEMSQISSIATKLGDQTMGAGDRIADFAALLANQSIPRLDNFGISSGRVRQRIDELLASGAALNREQAFKMAVMEEGAKSLDTLGNVSDLTSVKMAELGASLQTAKQGFAEIIAEDIAGLAGDIEKTGKAVRDLPTRFRDWREAIQGTTFAYRANNEEILAAQEATRKQREETENASAATRAMTIDLVTGTESHRQYADAMDISNAGLDQLAISSVEYNDHQQFLAGTVGDESAEAFAQYSQALLDTEEAQDKAFWASKELADQLRDEAEAAMETAEAHLSQAMQYTDFEEDVTRTAEDFADKRATIETKHQEALVEIAKKGQSGRKEIDEEGLRLEARIDEGRLNQLLERQAEFTDETTDLDRARTEQSIRNLQGEIAKKTDVLAVAQDGFIVMKGQNTDALLAEETRQYEESLTKQAEAQALQEEAQQQSLGRMILNHFNAWVEMNLAADGFTQEEAQFVTDMRNEIALEYGLITDIASQKMAEQENRWAAAMAVMRGEATSFFDFFTQQFNSLPSEKVIRIRTELATASVADPTRLGGETNAGGTAFAGGGLSLVGEQGPELAFLPRGASVLPADQSRHISNNFNLSVNSPSSSMGVQNEFAMMQSLAA